MHEVGIAEELLRSAEESALRAGCRILRRIEVRIGMFSSVEPEALTFAFEALKPGTRAAAAELVIERVQPRARCGACRREFVPAAVVVLCPGCGQPGAEVTGGFELDLMRIEAE
jgi:hydrogenase nickel incorporation protein HypA/HybF